jgi:hypothetical protein
MEGWTPPHLQDLAPSQGQPPPPPPSPGSPRGTRCLNAPAAAARALPGGHQPPWRVCLQRQQPQAQRLPDRHSGWAVRSAGALRLLGWAPRAPGGHVLDENSTPWL